MAIHFNYIKGLNGDVRNLTGNNADSIYTYIKWANRKDFSLTEPTNPGTIKKDAACLPHIWVGPSNTFSDLAQSDCDCGHIITSNATNQIFYQEIKHNKSIQLYTNTTKEWSSICFFCNPSIAGAGATGSLGKIFAKETNEDIPNWTKKFNNAGLCVDMGGLFVKDSFYINQTIDGKARVVSYKPLRIDDKGGNTDYVEISEGNIEAKGHIDSLFFNATSDQRAKSHIQLFKSNALDIVNKLPVYEFHYRNNDTPSIGVLAQDAVIFDEQFTDFSLVDNPNATGEDGDYMTIKESKLVYILWKAVQEQQKQIYILQAELNELKESQ